MALLRPCSVFLVPVLMVGSALSARGQDVTAEQIVQTVVNNELAADKNTKTHFMYKSTKKTPDKSLVRLTIETPKGNVTRTLAINGHPLTPEQRQKDDQQIQQLISDSDQQKKQARDRHEDGEKARNMMKMLPQAFRWTKVSDQNGVTTLNFRPNPKFEPPDREARVFAAMAGTMKVDDRQMRLKQLSGALMQDVEFGWGLLGRLRKGGTFDVKRTEVAPGIWEITETHVHIAGRALLFKSIDQNEDEVTSDFKRVSDTLSLEQAAAMLKKGDEQAASGSSASAQVASIRH
jgi:hypothetical protein